MKRNLAILLFVNLTLVAVLIYFLKPRNVVPEETLAKQSLPVLEKPISPPANHFHWRQVESEDYRKYIANLRRISCPEETIRDIIIADVNKLYAARRAEFFHENRSSQDWWKPKQPRPTKKSNEAQQLVRELEKEKRALIRELLGIDLDEETEKYELVANENLWQLDSVPAEKRNAVRALLERFDVLQKSLMAEEDGPTDWPKLREAYKSREAELARLLSPTELEEFQLRNDEVAETLRHHLAAFHPNEQEFRELFRTLKKHQSEFAYIDLNDEKNAQQNHADLERANERIKEFLGEQRYAEYQRAQSYQFQNLHWLTQQYDLPEESATTIFEANRSARERLAKLQTNTALTEEQKAAGLRQLQEELQATIKSNLGDQAYRYFQRWENSHWLQN